MNMAETEISIMNGQCLERRLDSQALIPRGGGLGEQAEGSQARIHWTFTLAAAAPNSQWFLPVNRKIDDPSVREEFGRRIARLLRRPARSLCHDWSTLYACSPLACDRRTRPQVVEIG